MAATTDSGVLPGSPQAVDVAGIERELTRLWKPAEEGENRSDGPAFTRACSLNLMIFGESEALAQRATEVVGSITPDHPCRAILLLADPQSSISEVKAWISAHCSLRVEGRSQVCCEQISLRVRGEAAAHLAEIVRPLLIPDLPVVLWWPGLGAGDNPPGVPLIAEADRLVVDTGRGPGGAKFDWLTQYTTDPEVSVVVSDLNWVRLLPWRELTAQFFDPLHFRLYLDRLDQVVIEYAGDPESPEGKEGLPAENSRALLLAAWLASRLGWSWTGQRSVGGSGGETFSFHRAGTLVPVTLCPQASSFLSPGEISRLCLEASCADPPARFLLESDSTNLVSTSVEVPAACPLPRTVRIDRHDEAHLLCGELEEVGPDRVYEAALALAAQMVAEEPG